MTPSSILFITSVIVFLITCLSFILFIISSLKEKEFRAVLLATAFLIINSIFWGIFLLMGNVRTINILSVSGFLVFIILSVIKCFPRSEKEDLNTIQQYDERDHMFSRNMLKFYPEIAQKYYTENPEKKEVDRQIHQKPELGDKGGKYYDYYYSTISQTAFTYLEKTRNASFGNKSENTVIPDKEYITSIIKKIAFYYGAADIGITRIKNYYYYSHTGRRPETWGEKIEPDHTYAIVVLVAMNPMIFKESPALPVLLESTKYYVEVAKISHLIAEFIRSIGYDARSHTDANYEVFCVPAARDAGLGEVGRLGILIHPVYGPCVRLCVVTTDLELQETKRKEYHIENFCRICRKCAENCPTASINKGEKESSRGFKHWFINQEACFSFWKTIGTDCGFCIRVCPYTKPDTFIHKLVRWYVSRNPVNQRIALFFDDFFYGRKMKLKYENPDLDKIF